MGNAFYGIVGNGETVALIAPDLAVDWFCAPRVDSVPFFAGALDPRRGGAIRLQFNRHLEPVKQYYITKSNVLVTEAAGGGLNVTVTDFMPWRKQHLTRLIVAKNDGEQPLNLKLAVLVAPIASCNMPFTYREDGQGTMILQSTAGTLCLGFRDWPGYNRLINLGVLNPGESRELRMAVGYGTAESAAQAAWQESFQDDVSRTVYFWHDWLSRARPYNFNDARFEEAYLRSLLVMKLLTFEQTGAILAAPTASFPAVPGGSDNWDYRYCWLRDGYFNAMAFDDAGFHQEASQFYSFAFALQEDDGSWRQPLYTVDGKDPEEYSFPDLACAWGEQPVRFGNQAARQLQLDNAGNLIHGLWYHYQSTGDSTILRQYWDNIRRATAWLERHWYKPEQGIWEIRERMDHWVYGKVLAVVALRSASRIAATLGHQTWAYYWAEVAIQVYYQVVKRGWSPTRQSYLRHYGDDAPLDSSVLALELYGLLPPDHPKMQATIRRLEQQAAGTNTSPEKTSGLSMAGGILRWEGAALPFYLTTLWLAQYHLHAGNRARAEELVNLCLDCASDLLLMGEHFDPVAMTQWGNFPQTFSHQAIVRFLAAWAGLARHE